MEQIKRASKYTYDEQSALDADKAASQLTEGGGYVGQFKKVWDIVSENTGTEGLAFETTVPGVGELEFNLYTFKEDGTPVFGKSFVDAMQFLFGLKELKGESGLIMKYDADEKKRVEVEGIVYPELCGKPIGLVFERELYSTNKGGTGSRLNLKGVYQPETRLMVSEIKERKVTPIKLERLLKQVEKVKDSRKGVAAEPSQPSLGLAGVEY